MRSRREIIFRLRQEAANALLAVSSPNLRLAGETPFGCLPAPSHVAAALRTSDYLPELTALAEEVLQGRVPVFGEIIDYGETIPWRRDPLSGIETHATYFRKIPYLDVGRAGDHKFIWEINRHQHLVLLAQAEVLTGQRKYGDCVFRQLEQWWECNPFQRGINWTSALEVAFRSLSWLWVYHLIGGRMPANLRRRFLAELYRHGLHLEYNLSIYFSPNTHLLGEAVALHALGRLFPGWPRSSRWRQLGREVVDNHLQVAVRPDGSYFEQSTYYHVYALDMFAFHSILEDVSDSYRYRLAKMAEFLAAIVTVTGRLPFLGDDDGGRFFHPYGDRSQFARGSLAVASLCAHQQYFPYDRRDLTSLAVWWLGPERCDEQWPPSTVRQSKVFGDTGIVVFRGKTVSALFDCGPLGPGNAGHSHADTLSLVVSNGDDEVLIDPGTFSYMDPEWRDAFRGTGAHNTIRIDDRDQALASGPFRWTQKPSVKFIGASIQGEKQSATAECSYQEFVHKRTVEFDGSEFCISDQIAGPEGEHHIEQLWHFAVEPKMIRPGVWQIGDTAQLQVEGGEMEQTWRSRCLGSKEPAWAVVVRARVTLPTELSARLRMLER